MKPYVLTSPTWETTSGGVRVMYGLYGWLLARGQVAFMNQKPSSGDCIGIYPEIQEGNPANASTVVRYILNKPGVIPAVYDDGTVKEGPTQFDPNDKLYYFSRLFGDTDPAHYMFLPILNLHLFKDQKKVRDKTAVFIGKGMTDPNLATKFIHPTDSFLIERDFAQDQQALADLLNECDVLYTYDPVSAITELARLCGCRIVMVNPLYTKEEFLKYEPGMEGISWGRDEGVKLNVNIFREHYISMVKDFEVKIDQFIEETQS